MHSGNGGDDSRNGPPVAVGGFADEAREEQQAPQAPEALTHGDQSPRENLLYIDEDYSSDSSLGDQRPTSVVPRYQTAKSRTAEPDPKQARMDVHNEAQAPSIRASSPTYTLQSILCRAGGPPVPSSVTEDVLHGIVMPKSPWFMLKLAQPGPLPEVNLTPPQIAKPRQQDLFRVTDDTETGWEYFRRCKDHGHKKGVRYHPNIRTMVPDWPKFERDSTVTARQRADRARLGDQTVNCFGKAHLVFAASRYMRHHPKRVVKFLDAIMATWVKHELEAHVDTFYRKIRSGEIYRSSKEIKAGTRKPDDAINAQSTGFCGLEALQAIRLWNLRCEPARKYYVDHPHGPAFFATEFLNSDLVDAGLRVTFRQTLLDAFSNRIDHARLRSYIEEVTREQSQPLGADGEPEWPPKLLNYQVDYRRTYWSQTCILMDGWAKAHFALMLRKDVDALQLDADPGVAGDELSKLFFAGSVERIVLMYGSDALNQDQANGIIPFYSRVVNHLTGTFRRARVYVVLPAFTRRKKDGWKDTVLKLINSAELKQLATVVYHPVDLRLMTYFEAYGSEAAWPAEVRSIMDESATLFEEGVMERKRHMVINYDLRLWTDDGLALDWTMLSEADLRQRSKDAIHMTVRHFGVPTVGGTGYEEMRKPSNKRAWKPKSTPRGDPVLFRQDRQQFPRGNNHGHQDRRQRSYARSTSDTHSSSGANPSPAGQQPVTMEGFRRMLEQALARQRAEFEALWARQQPSLSHQTTPRLTLGLSRPSGYRGAVRTAAAAVKQGHHKGSTRNLSVPGSAQTGSRRRHDSTQGRRSDARRAQSITSTAPPHAARPVSTLPPPTAVPSSAPSSSATTSSSGSSSTTTSTSSTGSTEITGSASSSSAMPSDATASKDSPKPRRR